MSASNVVRRRKKTSAFKTRKTMPLFSQTKSNEPEQPSFLSSTTLEKRKTESQNMRDKYPDRIPCIIERAASSKNSLPLIDKKKFLVPGHMTFGQLILIIRKRIKLDPEQAIFLFVNNVIPPSTQTMDQVYKEHQKDGFLLATYAAESTFG